MLCTHCSSEIKPVVALDIDGTLACYHSHFIKFAAQWLGFKDNWMAVGYAGDVPLHEYLGVSLETYRTIKLAFRQGGMKRSMDAYTGAGRLSERICLGLECELWITTTRPYLRLDNIDPDTRCWLDRNGVMYDHLFYDDDKYHTLLDRVDKDRIVCVVDDEAEQISRANAMGLDTIWRKTNYNGRMPSPVLSTPGAVALQAPTLGAAYLLIEDLVKHWRHQHG